MCAHTVSLVWDNHHSLLINVINGLLENNVAVNCTIVAEGHQVKVHQVLLSSFSPFFKLLFEEETTEYPTIILADTNYQDLRALIHYMYHGKLEIPQDQIKSLLETANYLQIKGLGGASEDHRSEKTNQISPLCEEQMYSNPPTHKRKNGDGAEISTQSDTMESQSYVQHLTPSVSSEYRIGQSPIHSMSFDITLESSVQRLSSYSAPSTSYSSEPNSLPFRGEPVVKVEPQDEMFSSEAVHPLEPERQENEEENFCYNSRNTQRNSKEANICVKSEDNSRESALMQDCTSSNESNMPPAESSFSMTSRTSDRTLNVSFARGELNNATTDTNFLFVDPGELNSDEFLHSELDLKAEVMTDEEIAMTDGGSDPCMKQGETLEEDEHIGKSGNYCSGARSQTAVSYDESSLLHSPQASELLETTAQSPIYITVKNDSETNDMPHNLNSNSCTQYEYNSNEKGEGSYKCTQCNYEAINYFDIIKHRRIHGDVRPYKCTLCNYATIQNCDLIKHSRIHTGVKPYKCTECEYASAQKCNLIKHRRIHTGERPYKCTECNYSASVKFALTTHSRVHSRAKPYKCTECNFAASQKETLRNHIRTHTGERPYKCLECDYASARKEGLILHCRIHTGVKPYKCAECHYASSFRSALVRHLIIHSEEKP